MLLKALLADDGDFCAGDFYAVEAMLFVEVEEDFDVGGAGAKAFIGFAVYRCGTGGFDGDGSGS
jgi:hypothetical protein